MNSRDIVHRTLEFGYPKRVARSFGQSDLLMVQHTAKTHATDWQKLPDGRWQRTDEWANVWARLDSTSKGEVIKGAIENIKEIDSYEFPDFSNTDDYEVVRKTKAEHPDKWLVGDVPGFAFNIARKLRRFDQYLFDLAAQPAIMHQLHDRIDIVVEQMMRNYATAGADSIMFLEDWGTQDQLFINPKMWQQEFLPRFEKLFAIAHECGLKVFMHSCGKIEAIIPHLIDAGVDLFQFDQPELHGLDRLASYQERAKITFWSPVDIQTTLQTRSEKLIRARVRQMLDKLWHAKGGFIAGYYDDNPSIGLEPKWQEYACREFLNHGVRQTYNSGNKKM